MFANLAQFRAVAFIASFLLGATRAYVLLRAIRIAGSRQCDSPLISQFEILSFIHCALNI